MQNKNWDIWIKIHDTCLNCKWLSEDNSVNYTIRLLSILCLSFCIRSILMPSVNFNEMAFLRRFQNWLDNFLDWGLIILSSNQLCRYSDYWQLFSYKFRCRNWHPTKRFMNDKSSDKTIQEKQRCTIRKLQSWSIDKWNRQFQHTSKLDSSWSDTNLIHCIALFIQGFSFWRSANVSHFHVDICCRLRYSHHSP